MNEARQVAAGAAKPVIGASAAPQEFLTFTLGREEYGIEILKVQEIRSYEVVTTIAMSAYINVQRTGKHTYPIQQHQRQ